MDQIVDAHRLRTGVAVGVRPIGLKAHRLAGRQAVPFAVYRQLQPPADHDHMLYYPGSWGDDSLSAPGARSMTNISKPSWRS